MNVEKVAYRNFKESTVVQVFEVDGMRVRFSGENKTGKLQTQIAGDKYFEPFEWNFVPKNVKIGTHNADRFECVMYQNLNMIDVDQFKATVLPINGPVSLLELQKLLSVVECLIDTAHSTTDLEGVYSDSDEQFFNWEEVNNSYQLLKRLANVE